MDLVRRLEDIHQDDAKLVGGKGANLGALTQSAFSVPPGFVLLTSAYKLFVAMNDIQQEIEQISASIALDEPLSAERASYAIHALIEAGSMPCEVAEAVLTAYTQLGEPAVAVRSSATTEDQPGASFAGQHESYLNIRTADELLIAVQRCWSSLWTVRALNYGTHQGIDPGSVSMAVVVQQLVSADAAGVLFTVNPVTGASDEVLINAVWGLGESLVDGRVAPDTIVTEKASGQVKQIEIGDKTVMTVPSESGTAERAVDPVQRQVAVLSTDQMKELTTTGREIEQHFKTPARCRMGYCPRAHLSTPVPSGYYNLICPSCTSSRTSVRISPFPSALSPQQPGPQSSSSGTCQRETNRRLIHPLLALEDVSMDVST